jgi:hypothetical protein
MDAKNIPLGFIYHAVGESSTRPFRAVEDAYGTVLAADPANWFTLLGRDYPPTMLRNVDRPRWEDRVRAWAAGAGWIEADEETWLNHFDMQRVVAAWNRTIARAERAEGWVELQHVPTHYQCVIEWGIYIYDGPRGDEDCVIVRLGDRAWHTNCVEPDDVFDTLIPEEV